MESEYQFDQYRTWIVRDDVLARVEDGDEDVALAERVPHPTVEDIAADQGEMMIFVF